MDNPHFGITDMITAAKFGYPEDVETFLSPSDRTKLISCSIEDH